MKGPIAKFGTRVTTSNPSSPLSEFDASFDFIFFCRIEIEALILGVGCSLLDEDE